MMVLLLYIQNQDKQKMTKKKSNQIPRKKKFRILLLPKTTPKNPSTKIKNLPHTTIFFTSNEQDTRKKKITKRKQNKQEKKK